MTLRTGGLFGMHCWNGLSPAQQERLIEIGNLEIGFQPEGWCLNPAELGIETKWDNAPGERFYCLGCAIQYLADVERSLRTTKTGKVLTDADIEALADEAEEGYDVSQIKERRGPQA